VRRIAALSLGEVRIEIARGLVDADDAPLAVVIARPGGAVQKETDILGNTRLDVVSREARVHGVRTGDTVAGARAKIAEITVRVVAESAVRDVLARVAEACLAFGPTVAFDEARDLVFIDVTGCAHLHGGERALGQAAVTRVASLGHTSRVAIADGPRIAAALAIHGAREVPAGSGPRRTNVPAGSGPRRTNVIVVAPGEGKRALRDLPLSALPVDEDTVAWLKHVGMRRCGDLQRLPARALGTRLGGDSGRRDDVMLLLRGEDPAPLTAYRPPEVIEEKVELEYGVESSDAVAFVTKVLCDRVSSRLEGRAVSASRLELVFALDRALSVEPAVTLAVTLPAPLRRAADLLSVLRARLESFALPAPALAVGLRVPETARVSSRALHMFEPEAKADLVLPRLVAEIGAELGEGKVGTLALADSWIPEERTRLLPYGAVRPRTYTPQLTAAAEPSRIVPPRPCARGEVQPLKLLSRVETVEWWRRGALHRDLYAAWSPDSGAVAWVEVDRTSGSVTLRGWLDG
jgi:protein ImuB